MLTYEFSMNIIVLFAIIAIAVYAGYRSRSGQIGKSRLQITSLEHEMINNHTEILELHKEYMDLKIKLQSIENNAEQYGKVTSGPGQDQLRSVPLAHTLRTENNKGELRKQTYQLNFNSLLKK